MGELQTTAGNLPSTLNRELSEVTERLQPASHDGIAAAILKLHRAGLSYPPGVDPVKAGDIYAFALKGVALEAIKRAMTKIIQGEIPGVRDFIPTPPALAAIVKAEASELWRHRERLLLALDSVKAGGPGAEATPEAKARVRALVAGVRAAAADVREQERRGYQASVPLTHDQAEYFSKILALKDAPAVSADHMAARRFASKKIEEADPPHVEPVQVGYFLALQQQEEMENGKSNDEAKSGPEDQGRSGDADRPEGHEERDGGD